MIDLAVAITLEVIGYLGNLTGILMTKNLYPY